jgi:hypothetical protein
MAIVIAIAAATTFVLDGAIKLENLVTRGLFSAKFLHKFYLYTLPQTDICAFYFHCPTNLLTYVPQSNGTIDN